MKKQLVSKGTQALAVAPGASGVILSFDQAQFTESDVYLVGIGNIIDLAANQSYATFRLLVNGSPAREPYGNMTSSIGSPDNPDRPSPPILLGRGCKVELTGAMDAGATGTTTMVGRVDLLLVPAGTPPF